MYSIYVCMCIDNCIVYHKLTTSTRPRWRQRTTVRCSLHFSKIKR